MVRGTVRLVGLSVLVTLVGGVGSMARVSAQAPRPMTFLDMQQMRNVGAPTPSADGRWMLYTLSTPDWQAAERQGQRAAADMRSEGPIAPAPMT